MITQDLPGASIFLSLLVNSPSGSDHRPENHISRQRESYVAFKYFDFLSVSDKLELLGHVHEPP